MDTLASPLPQVTTALTLPELTEAMNRFVAAMGWYRADSVCQQSPRNIAISLALEAAEVLEHYQWGENANPDALAEELADVSLYLLQLAYLNGIDLGQAILDKLAVNYRRFGPPVDPDSTDAHSGN